MLVWENSKKIPRKKFLPFIFIFCPSSSYHSNQTWIFFNQILWNFWTFIQITNWKNKSRYNLVCRKLRSQVGFKRSLTGQPSKVLGKNNVSWSKSTKVKHWKKWSLIFGFIALGQQKSMKVKLTFAIKLIQSYKHQTFHSHVFPEVFEDSYIILILHESWLVLLPSQVYCVVWVEHTQSLINEDRGRYG